MNLVNTARLALKLFLLFAFFAFTPNGAVAKDSQACGTKDKADTSSAVSFGIGSWSTDTITYETAVAANLPKTVPSMIFCIKSEIYTDGVSSSWVIINDNVEYSLPVWEGGQVSFEGRNISLRQERNPSTQGQWEILFPENNTGIVQRTSWTSYPNTRVVIAKFDKPRLAVLHYTNAHTGCANGRATFYADQAPLRNSQVVKFPLGSGVLTYGSEFSVIVDGTCSDSEGLYGGSIDYLAG